MRARGLPVAAVLAIAAGESAIGAAHGASVTRDRSFAFTSPADGASVPANFVLSWHRLDGQTRYAILIDETPPPPGTVITSTPTRLIANGITALGLSLAPRQGGSPSLRHWHTVTIVPLNAQGRRVGEQSATVHVREET